MARVAKTTAAHRKALMGQMQFLGQRASTETALFHQAAAAKWGLGITDTKTISVLLQEGPMTAGQLGRRLSLDRKSTRLNSSHSQISYAVFCLNTKHNSGN